MDQPRAPPSRRKESTAASTSQTIRAVTPESSPDDSAGHAPSQSAAASTTSTTSTATASSTTTATPAPPAASPPLSPRAQPPRGLVVRANSSEPAAAARDLGARPRTRTLEERSLRDRSPPNLFVSSRHRIGSVHSAAAANLHALEEAVVTSIGHPSIAAAPAAHPPPPRTSSSTRARLLNKQSTHHALHHNHHLQQPPPRVASPVSIALSAAAQGPAAAPGAPAAANAPDSWVSPVPASDARKVLRLMRSTCGKMQGMLAFRRGESNPWSLSYCYINDDAGSLVYEPKSDTSYHRTLIPDLRGCRVKSAYDAESYTAYIHVLGHNSNLEVSLRPPTQDEFESWFAALLCWQPIRPKGIQNKMAKPQTPIVADRQLSNSRRHSEVSLLKEAPIIKVGKMIYWDTSVTYSNTGTPKSSSSSSAARPQAYRIQSHGSRRWRRVSCTLRENGELKLYSDTDVALVSVVQLSQLSRCAVQRLDPSVLDNEFCIAIYPQYTSTSTSLSLLRPIFLSLESRVLYEVWIVLLRAFTIPQLYGPKQPTLNEEGALSPAFGTQDMFRMERSLFIRVTEARLIPPVSPKIDTGGSARPPSASVASGGYYVEVLLDGETRARTMAKSDSPSPFWREDFEFLDLPAVLSTASLLLKRRPPAPSRKDTHESQLSSDSFLSESAGGYTGISFDQTCGKADIYLDDLGPNQEIEKWWPLVNMYGNSVGEVLVKVSAHECVILMARDYQPMSELLHRFENGLTLQIAHMVPTELKRLSEYLLNIFQVSGQAMKWISSLVEEEIDGTLKDSPASRLRFSKRLGSADSNDSSSPFPSNSDRELFVRDMGNNAKLEANLLFRGNTLLTKALDCHMKRLGKEYLEETIAEKLREINDRDYECEVDPNRIESRQELERNWRRLINLTEELWRAIYSSASRCPQELRLIFRHIRACAEDRYGDFLRTVQYSSVSGFLFLRFFVPAILNPKLFGLLKDHPKPRARRTLTLIAKSLQGLANMSSFGTKESWMEPMNTFLTSHRQEFKTYIDSICSISSTTSPAPHIPPSYSTPLAILQRLPPTSREGFPSLPYLIDHARNFAALVDLWLEGTQQSAMNIQATDGDLLRFHNICVTLNERTNECLNRAERAERPSSTLSVKWEELVEQLQGSASFEPSRGAATRKKLSHQPSTSTLPEIPALSPTSPTNNSTVATSGGDDEGSEGTSTPITMKPARPYNSKTRHVHSSSVSASQSSFASLTNTAANMIQNPFSRKEGRLTYTPSESPSASASASASAAEDETPPGSADGLHFPPHPPFAYPTPPVPRPQNSVSSFSTHPNLPINLKQTSQNTNIGVGGMTRPPRSAGGQSVEGSEAGSEDFTTALPRFDKDRESQKKERGLQKILPFKRRPRDKEQERREKEEKRERKEMGKSRDRSRERERREMRDMERSRDRSMERRGAGGMLNGRDGKGDSATRIGSGMGIGSGIGSVLDRDRGENF